MEKLTSEQVFTTFEKFLSCIDERLVFRNYIHPKKLEEIYSYLDDIFSEYLYEEDKEAYLKMLISTKKILDTAIPNVCYTDIKKTEMTEEEKEYRRIKIDILKSELPWFYGNDINIKNIFRTNFNHTYSGIEISIKAGETKSFSKVVGHHMLSSLVAKEMNRLKALGKVNESNRFKIAEGFAKNILSENKEKLIDSIDIKNK